MKKNEHLDKSLITTFASFIVLVNGFITYQNNEVDKIGTQFLYIRLGMLIVLMILCSVTLICFFKKKMWKSNQKKLIIVLLVLSSGLGLLEISSLADCCADLAGGTKSVYTNDYPIVWDKIFISGVNDDYAYVSDDIAKYLNENKVLTITTNLEIERESYVEVTYYPQTHILISAEVVK